MSHRRYPPDWDSRKESVLERDEYQCCNCDSRENLQVHHIVPVANNGTDRLSNLVAICEGCHDDVHRSLLPDSNPDTDQSLTHAAADRTDSEQDPTDQYEYDANGHKKPMPSEAPRAVVTDQSSIDVYHRVDESMLSDDLDIDLDNDEMLYVEGHIFQRLKWWLFGVPDGVT